MNYCLKTIYMIFIFTDQWFSHIVKINGAENIQCNVFRRGNLSDVAGPTLNIRTPCAI